MSEPYSDNGSPPAPVIGADTVGSAEIVDGEVMTVDLDDGAVTDAKIAGPVSASKLDTDFVELAGDTMTGALNMGSNDISAVDDLTVNAAGSLNIGDTTVTNSFANTLDVANDLYISGSNDLYLDTGSDISAMALQLKMQNGRIFLDGGEITAIGGTAATDALGIGINGDTSYRLLVEHDGDLQFGPGNATQDVRLGWSAANTIAMGSGDKIQQNEPPTAGDDLVNKTALDAATVFGTEYQYAKDITLTATSNGSGSPVEHQRITTPSLPAGTYLVQLDAAWRSSNTSSEVHIGLHQDPDGADTVLDNMEESAGSNNATDQYRTSMCEEVVLSGGVEEFACSFYKKSGTGTVSIVLSKLKIWRVL